MCEKHRRLSRGAAEAHMRSLLKFKPDYDGRPYLCGHCKAWHVGRMKKASRKNRYSKTA